MENIDLDYKTLPANINLELAADTLGLSNLSIDAQIDTLIQHHNDSVLPFHSNLALDCMAQLASGGYEESRDGGHLIASQTYRNFVTYGEPLKLGKVHKAGIGDYELYSDSLFIGGHEFYQVDDEVNHLTPFYWNISDLYIKRDEFLIFQGKGYKSLPSYADPESESYAPELALAVKLHKAIREDGYKSGSYSSVKDRADAWLRHEIGSFTDAKLKRMATIIGKPRK
tara:strand:+ start:578 stop:1258 length:681 start_codon:yes stop_codon:yes gene_type:complete